MLNEFFCLNKNITLESTKIPQFLSFLNNSNKPKVFFLFFFSTDVSMKLSGLLNKKFLQPNGKDVYCHHGY